MSKSLPNVRKAAQVAAFFAREQGGKINILKLSKLLYLADRECMERFDSPMLFDHLVSMDHGPVTSVTLNYANGMYGPHPEWDEFVAARKGYDIAARDQSNTDISLDELSRAELTVLHDVWRRFGHMTQYQIRDYTHAHCPEWTDPKGSSDPIPYRSIFAVLNKSNPDHLSQSVEDRRWIEAVFQD